MTAAQSVALLRGTGRSGGGRGADRTMRPGRGGIVTEIATGAATDEHRLWDRRLAGAGGRGLHLRERPSLRRGRRPYVAIAARGEGCRIAYDRRFSSELSPRRWPRSSPRGTSRSPTALHAVPTQMSSFEVLERGAAAGIVITASHNPWIDNGFKVKAPTGAAAGAEILWSSRRALGSTAGAHRAAAVRRGRSGRPRRAVRPVRRATSGSSGGRVDLEALRAADVSMLVDPMWGAGSGWISRLLAGGRIRVNEIHQERNPYFGGVNPEPIRPNIDEALAISPGAVTTLGCCSTATPTGRAPRTSAARSSTSSRSPGC